MLLKELQKCGLHLRKLKEKLYCYCEKRVFVKGSTILKMYAKIEETQREYNRLDNRTGECTIASYFFVCIVKCS